MARKKKSVVLKEQIHSLVDGLAEQDLPTAKRFLAYLYKTKDPFVQKLVEAPYDDEPLTKEDIAALDEAWEAVAKGEVYSDEELRKELGL